MAFYLNNKRYVEEKKPDGTLEHREIMEYYLDGENDVEDLPGRDQIDECSRAVLMGETPNKYGTVIQGLTYILMTDGWVCVGVDKTFNSGGG
jgi:hypothetical protein